MQGYLQKVALATSNTGPNDARSVNGEGGERWVEVLARAEAAEASLVQQGILHAELAKAIDAILTVMTPLKEGVVQLDKEASSPEKEAHMSKLPWVHKVLDEMAKVLKGEQGTFVFTTEPLTTKENEEKQIKGSGDTKEQEEKKGGEERGPEEKKGKKAGRRRTDDLVERGVKGGKGKGSVEPKVKEAKVKDPLTQSSPLRKPTRVFTVEDLMREVGESQVVSKHDWLFGGGSSGASGESPTSGSGKGRGRGKVLGSNSRSGSGGKSPDTSEPFLPAPRKAKVLQGGERVDPSADPLRPSPRPPSPPIPPALAARLKQGATKKPDSQGKDGRTKEVKSTSPLPAGSGAKSSPDMSGTSHPVGKTTMAPTPVSASGILSSPPATSDATSLSVDPLGLSGSGKRGRGSSSSRKISAGSHRKESGSEGTNLRKVSAASFLSEVEGFESRVKEEQAVAEETKRLRETGGRSASAAAVAVTNRRMNHSQTGSEDGLETVLGRVLSGDGQRSSEPPMDRGNEEYGIWGDLDERDEVKGRVEVPVESSIWDQGTDAMDEAMKWISGGAGSTPADPSIPVDSTSSRIKDIGSGDAWTTVPTLSLSEEEGEEVMEYGIGPRDEGILKGFSFVSNHKKEDREEGGMEVGRAEEDKVNEFGRVNLEAPISGDEGGSEDPWGTNAHHPPALSLPSMPSSSHNPTDEGDNPWS